MSDLSLGDILHEVCIVSYLVAWVEMFWDIELREGFGALDLYERALADKFVFDPFSPPVWGALRGARAMGGRHGREARFLGPQNTDATEVILPAQAEDRLTYSSILSAAQVETLLKAIDSAEPPPSAGADPDEATLAS
jgi:hypothetical protein